MSENNEGKIEVKAVNMTVDVKLVILKILEESERSFTKWVGCESGHGYVREMHSNNQSIKYLLEAIK
jgi:enolase